MQISAVQKLTLLDFPGRTACTVFTPGCNFRCGYCHNAEFVIPERIEKIKDSFIPEETLFNFLKKRKGLLDGVCVTGGEPSLQPDLSDFFEKVRELGFATKLDTNGSKPEVLRKLLDKKLLDYVAMDVKSSPEKYLDFVGIEIADKVAETRDLIMRSDIDYEFRTTVVRELIHENEFKKILEFVRGAKKYALQNFSSRGGCLEPKFEKYNSFTKDELEGMCEQAEEYVEECLTRD